MRKIFLVLFLSFLITGCASTKEEIIRQERQKYEEQQRLQQQQQQQTQVQQQNNSSGKQANTPVYDKANKEGLFD